MIIKSLTAGLFAALICTAQTPQVSRIVSAGSFGTRIAAGAYATILGAGLADGTYIANGGAPWPLTLGGTTVAICYSETAGAQPTCVSPQLLYVSPQQINVLMPNLWMPIPNGASGLGETVYVVRGSGASQIQSNGVLFTVLLESPDILLAGYDCPITADYICPPLNSAKTESTDVRRGTVTDLEGRLVDTANPVVVGGYYTIWLTGLGNGLGNTPCVGFGLNNCVGVGLVPFNPPSPLPAGYPTSLGGDVTPTFAGASPQFPGLQQINFQFAGSLIPSWPCANYTLEMTLSVAQSQQLFANLPVQIPVVIHSGDVACQ